MKTLLLAFVFSMLAATGQQFEIAYHEGIANPYGALSYGGRLYFVEYSQKIASCCAQKLYLVKTSASGQILQRKMLGTWAYPEPPLLALSADHHLIVAGGTKLKGCDVTGDDFSIFKVDTTGTVVWEKKLSFIVTHLLTLSDSSIVFAADQKLWKWNLQGVQTHSIDPQLGPVHSVCNLNDGGFLVNHSNGGGSNLKRFSPSLQAGTSVATGHTLHSMQQMDDSSLVSLSGGILRRYDKNFLWLSSSDTNSQPPIEITAFCTSASKIYCGGREINPSLKMFYKQLNSSLSTDYGFVSNFNRTRPTAVAIVGNSINVLSTGQETHRFVSLAQFPKTGQVNASYDIGVVNSTVTNISWTGTFAEFQADVKVKNFGSQPIHQFQINDFVGSTLHDCLLGLNKAYTVTINPGDSVIVQTGVYYKPLPLGPSFPQTITLSTCYWSTVPDNHNDMNTANDINCVPQTFTITGVAENGSITNEIRIYPNPAREMLHIESAMAYRTIEILDLQGRLLLTKGNGGRGSVHLVHGLPAGIYLVRLQTAEGTFTKKLLIGD